MKAKIREKERHISKREMNMAIDIFFRMAMLVLIEDFGFGTKAQKGKTPRLQKFITSFENKAKYMDSTFGVEMLDGINAKLEMHGVALKDVKEKI